MQEPRVRTTSSPPPRFGHKAYVAAFVAILLVAAALRVRASLNELWFDEIWSYAIATEDVQAPLDVFTKVHHDNNNPLNTLLIHWIGPDQPLWAYRAAAILAGVGTVALAGLIALRWGRAESMAALILTAFSFLLIQYSSEARGYSLAVLFSMLCLLVGLKYVQRPGLGLALLLWVLLAAAWMSHLTAVLFYASFALWSAYALVRGAGHWKRALRAILTLHAVPAAMLAVYYWTCVRRFILGGGQDDGLPNVLARTVTLWIGAPLGTAGAIVALAAALCGTAGGLWLLARRRSSLWVLFGGVLSVSPAILLTVLRPAAFYERHFLVFLSFGLVLLALPLGWLYRRSAWGKAAFGVLVAGFLAGNGWHTAWLFEVGRGHSAEAFQYIERNTVGSNALVAGNNDLRTDVMLRFYWPRGPGHEGFSYVPREKDVTETAEWFVQDRQQYSPPARYVAILGRVYELAASFEIMSPQHPFCLSGWSWYVYHLAPDLAPGSGS